MSNRKAYSTVKDSELGCLICWPVGSVGSIRERQILTLLNGLCAEMGYGRIPQLTSQIEAIWRDPSSSVEFEKQRQKHLKLMSEAEEYFKK